MMTTRTAFATCGALSSLALLSGCASWFHSAGRHAGATVALVQAPVADEAAADGYAARQLAEGRKALDNGQYGAAVANFRNAQRFPEVAAAAHNGLGIAFAMLGRGDLAERYFREAVLEEPTNVTFAANLERFYSSGADLAARQVRSPAPALAEAQDEAAVEAPRLVRNNAGTAVLVAQSPRNQLERVSPREMRLSLAPAAPAVAAPQPSLRRRNPAYPIRLQLAPAAPLPAAKVGELGLNRAAPVPAGKAPTGQQRRRAAPTRSVDADG